MDGHFFSQSFLFSSASQNVSGRAMVRPIGTPCPSVSRLRFTPRLLRSVGLGPVFPPAQWGLGHRPIHREPVPVDSTQLLKLLGASLPEFEEDACLHSLLKAVMRARVRTQLGLIQRLPLASRSQDVEDGIRTVAIRRSWASSPETMRIHMHRKPRLQHHP
jgi:hypothetical protein